MRAMCRHQYGPPSVLAIEELPLPEPAAAEVRVRVVASSVSIGDCKIRGFVGIPALFWLPARLMFGLVRPRQPVVGSVFAGTVDAVGAQVSGFAVGDRVFGMHLFGSHAEAVCVRAEGGIAHLPDGVSEEDAAATVFGATTAVHFLEQARVQNGERILVIGAGGAVGSQAVQVAKAMGATVVGCARQRHRDLIAGLHVDDFMDAEQLASGTVDEAYDVVLDTTGRFGYGAVRRWLRPGGRYAAIDFGAATILRALLHNLGRRHRIVIGVSEEKPALMQRVAELLAAGSIRPVVDRHFAFAEIPDAHRHVQGLDGAGRGKFGSVVVRVAE